MTAMEDSKIDSSAVKRLCPAPGPAVVLSEPQPAARSVAASAIRAARRGFGGAVKRRRIRKAATLLHPRRV